MIEDFLWRYALYGVEVQHPLQQVHKRLVLVQAVTVVLFQTSWQVFETLKLFLVYLFAVSALNAKQAKPYHALPTLVLDSALQREPEGETGKQFQENGPQGPNVIGPRLLALDEHPWAVLLLRFNEV